jgi:hypothetical protein
MKIDRAVRLFEIRQGNLFQGRQTEGYGGERKWAYGNFVRLILGRWLPGRVRGCHRNAEVENRIKSPYPRRPNPLTAQSVMRSERLPESMHA